MQAPSTIARDPAAEQLLAVMDVESILEPGAKVRITADMRHRAARLPATIQAEIRRFLTAADRETERTLPEFRYKRCLTLLTEFDPQQRIEALAHAISPEDDAAGVIVAAGRAVKYLQDILPTRSRVTYTGPVQMQPNDLVLYRFRRSYAAIEDPMEVFHDMREGALCRDQVRVLQACYPSLHDGAEQALMIELARLKADRPTIELARWKVRQIENLLLTRSWTPDLARMMQDAFKKADKPTGNQPSPSGLSDKTTDASETPVQRIANK